MSEDNGGNGENKNQGAVIIVGLIILAGLIIAILNQ